MQKTNRRPAATNPGNMNIVNLKGSINPGLVAISQQEYEKLQKKAARADALEVENKRLRAAREEAEIRAEQIAEAAELEIQARAQEHQKELRFWVKAWCDARFWLIGAWQTVREVGAKLTHTERLMGNKNLEPEDRLYIYADAQITQGSTKVDPAGRALARRDEIMRRAGLSRSTCYRVAKKLEEAGILDAKTYTRQTATGTKKDRFEKLNQKAIESPDCLELPEKPKAETHHPACQECESDDTIVKQQMVKTITCRDCGTMRTETMPPLITINPIYRSDDADPHKSPCVNLKHGIKPGARATGGSSA